MEVRLALICLFSSTVFSQAVLDEAYAALRARDPERAAHLFKDGLALHPNHLVARKDYAYTLLKLGETELARDQFGLAMNADRTDFTSALEYAFLCHETRQRAEARRVFDRIRKDAAGKNQQTAQKAFENIEEALTAAIRQWSTAAEKTPESDSVHEELARLYEEHGDLELAEEHYAKAFRLKPVKRHFLLDLGRVRRELGKRTESLAAYLAASESYDVRTAERAREHLPGEPLPEDVITLAAEYSRMKSFLPSSARDSDVSTVEMADRSFQLSYLNDALRYYESAQETNPNNGHVLLRLGLIQNLLGRDDLAYEWLNKARKSSDATIASEAETAWRNLRPEFARYRLVLWTLPMYSSRWKSGFAYGQMKVELNRWKLMKPYVSLRFAYDAGSGVAPGPLSERAITPALGVATRAWHGITAWGEFGGNVGNTQGLDTRAGIAHVKGWGRQLGSEAPGLYYLMENSVNYASRFSHNTMIGSQNRIGYTVGRWQIGVLVGGSTDTRREYWANYYEVGPSFRAQLPKLPSSLFLNVEAVRGYNYVQQGNPRPANYSDIRIGLWYAFSY